MPLVKGKKYPYTKKGKEAAKKAKKESKKSKKMPMIKIVIGMKGKKS